MIPKGIIKEIIDKDLVKYEAFTLCDIHDVNLIEGIGLILNVSPVDGSLDLVNDVSENKKTFEGEVDTYRFPVTCINAVHNSVIKDIHEKYYALVISIVKNRPTGSPALLVPKSKYPLDKFDFNDIKEFVLKQGNNTVKQEGN